MAGAVLDFHQLPKLRLRAAEASLRVAEGMAPGDSLSLVELAEGIFPPTGVNQAERPLWPD